MRRLARGNTPEECKKSMKRMVGAGWKAITDVKLDDSLASWGEVSYVVVMERPDEPGKKKHHWNQDMPIW